MRQTKRYVADFETTVFEGQKSTEVWAAALVEIGTEDVTVFHSIEEFLYFVFAIPYEKIVYFHNLKWDGQFIMSYLHTHGYREALAPEGSPHYFKKKKYMNDNEFRYTISDRGQWYSVGVMQNGHMTDFLDSLKLIPFSVKQMGKAFNTKHRKLDMEYEGYRYAGCYISDEEKEYIKNDVLVVKEVLEIMFEEGHKEMTIGSCCIKEYKHLTGHTYYNSIFPDLTKISCPIEGFRSADEYIRKSYYGGWCYVKKGCENKIYKHGLTADVNSLYPSVMRVDEDGKRAYPVFKPTFWRGNGIPEKALGKYKYFFIRFQCRFKIKKGYLPFVQIKGSWLYRSTECLVTSDINQKGQYYEYYMDVDGNIKPAIVTLTMTQVDYYRFREHYDVYDFKILDGCYFDSGVGLFDEYIDKYFKMKVENNDNKALRTLAKLFLNNLYGRLAASDNSSFKVAFWDDENVMHFMDKEAHDKKPGFIAIGSAITSYARDFTIRTAQKNYKYFIYADTDSLHCCCSPEDLVDVPTHDTNLLHWKLESYWDEGLFVRQKTYIEHCTHEDGNLLDKPYYNVKCAGMNDRCKNLFLKSMGEEVEVKDLDSMEKRFLETKRSITDFKQGLSIPGKLMPKKIEGGVVLVKTTYEMR